MQLTSMNKTETTAALKTLVEKRLEMLGLTKQFVAKQMGIQPSQLSQIFSGYRRMQPHEADALKVTLGIIGELPPVKAQEKR